MPLMLWTRSGMSPSPIQRRLRSKQESQEEEEEEEEEEEGAE